MQEGIGIRTDADAKFNYHLQTRKLLNTAQLRINHWVCGSSPTGDIEELRKQLDRTKLYARPPKPGEEGFTATRYAVSGKEGSTLQDDLSVAFAMCCYIGKSCERNAAFANFCLGTGRRIRTELA